MSRIEQIREILKKNDTKKLKEIVREHHPVDIAELYAELSSEESLDLFNIFDLDFAVQILEKIEIEINIYLINIRRNYATKLLAEMSSDDVADFLES